MELLSGKEGNTEKFGLALVIDDDQHDLFFLTYSLQRSKNFDHILDLDNGVGIVNYIKGLEVLPDVIITDINMPQVSGFDILREIKEDHQLSSIPVIMFSTSNSDDDIEKSKKMGAKAYFTKPNNLTGYDPIGEILIEVLVTGTEDKFHFKLG